MTRCGTVQGGREKIGLRPVLVLDEVTVEVPRIGTESLEVALVDVDGKRR